MSNRSEPRQARPLLRHTLPRRPLPERTPTRHPLLRRKGVWWPIGVVAGVVTTALVVGNTMPWPAAMIIRKVFEDGAAKVKKALEPHSPGGIERLTNQPYRANGTNTMLDVYFPESAVASNKALPTVFWVHGGAWISGSKDDATPYFELLAAKGYTVVAPNYSIGPEQKYPAAVIQLNTALAYVQENARRFHIDPSRIVLAGDSAGSQLSSQLATIVTNPAYAREMDITPSLSAEQLKGVILACGVYDMAALTALTGLLGWGFEMAAWSYGGVRNYDKNPAMKQMSTIDFVTADFPAAFITGGNGDGLTAIQSKPFAKKLQSLGVVTTTLFFPADYAPELPHEYQFNLDNAAGQEALTQILGFLDSRFGSST